VRHTLSWAELKIGYARVSTDGQDLTAQRDALHALSVPAGRVYVDHGLTGTNRDRPELRDALTACSSGTASSPTSTGRTTRTQRARHWDGTVGSMSRHQEGACEPLPLP